MPIQQTKEEDVILHVRNIGGIDEADVAFTPGATILSGRNATNRTSLLRALMGVVGSDDVSIKGDADEAYIELVLDDETYTREFRRENGVLTASGEPYLDDPTLANLFAFLLEANETRWAVARNENLRNLIMRPVNTEEIEAEIDRLVDEREQVKQEIDEIESLKGRLPSLEENRSRLEEQIETKREGIAEKQTELDSKGRGVKETREERDELEEKFAELNEMRSKIEDVRYDIETERETITQLRQERGELTDERSDVRDAPTGEIRELETKIERLRNRKQRLESEMGELQSIIGFNEEMLEGAGQEVLTALEEGAETESDAVTDQLLADETVTCWTCGTEVEVERIEATIDRLQELNQSKLTEIRDIKDEVSDLSDRRQTLQDKQRKRERIERRLDRIDEEIEDSETTIAELRERRNELTEEIAELETEVEESEDDSHGEVLDLHKEINHLEYELERVESQLDEVNTEITDIEDRIDELEELERERETLSSEITELRTKIDRIEQEVITEFNEHMDTILKLLGYENLGRIWLERVEQEVREGRRKVTKSIFQLHIVRSTDSGTTYEDTIDHLSESEREVTGLVFALAGYLAHDVYEEVPFMLLDSVEAIDSARIAALVEYFEGYAPYLIVALLPEDATALDEDYQYIREI